MKSRPILFSAPMVRAILEGRKTQTRRVVKPLGNDHSFVLLDYGDGFWPYRSDDGENAAHIVKRGGKLYSDEIPHSCPYGYVGDRLWARETWARGFCYGGGRPCTFYRATGDGLQGDANYPRSFDPQLGAKAPDGIKWRPSIHMPRWASRILLEVTGVRVERLADISKDDAMAEGIVLQPDGGFGLADSTHYNFSDPTDSYCSLWESINGAGSWMENPWVWVVEFKRLEGGAS